MKDILEYINLKRDPLLMREVICSLEIDEKGEPFISFSYSLFPEGEKISLDDPKFSVHDDLKFFAAKQTRKLRDDSRLNKFLDFVKPVVVEKATKYFKFEFGKDYNNDYSKDIILGFIIDPAKSPKMPIEEKIMVLTNCIHEIDYILRDEKYKFQKNINLPDLSKFKNK